MMLYPWSKRKVKRLFLGFSTLFHLKKSVICNKHDYQGTY